MTVQALNIKLEILLALSCASPVRQSFGRVALGVMIFSASYSVICKQSVSVSVCLSLSLSLSQTSIIFYILSSFFFFSLFFFSSFFVL